MPKPSSGRYMAGLDGLRALAVLAVIAYHLDPGLAPGGLLGVGVFFVLSGYLITDLLAAEWKRSGRIAMKPFLLRRARRLLPAMFLMLAAVGLWLALFEPSRLVSLKGDATAAVLYVSNWWFVFHEVSYFEQFGPPSPLGHLWSLAVEEQFYLLWPIIFAFGLRFAPRRGKLIALIAAGAAASALAMAFLYEPGTDPSRVYYGTDTRAFGLLIGAALAVVWPSAKLSALRVTPLARVVLDGIGTAGLIAVLLMMARTGEYDASLYRGGMVVLSVAAAVVVAVAAHPASRLGAWLGWKPLRWLGVRSYGIYLWHYPVIVLTRPAVQTGETDWVLATLQLAATIVLAALSWRYVEEPIRRGIVRKLWMRLRNRKRIGRKATPRTLIAASSLLVMIAATSVGAFKLYPIATASSVPAAADLLPPEQQPVPGHVHAPDPGTETAEVPLLPPDKVGKSDTGKTGGPGKIDGTSVPDSTGNVPVPQQPEQQQPTKQPTKETKPPETPKSETKPESDKPGQGITVIGDSVILDAKPYLEKLLPGIAVDGKIGRQLTHAADVIEALKSKDELGSRVVIELGTNGSFPRKKLESLLHDIGEERQVLLVNTRVPRPWEDEVNSTLADVAKSYSNITLVDWYKASTDKDTYFSPDGVHLNSEGAEAYATLLVRSLGTSSS